MLKKKRILEIKPTEIEKTYLSPTKQLVESTDGTI